MKIPGSPSTEAIADDIAEWLKRGGAITRLKVGKSHRRPLPYDFSHDGPLIEPERRRGDPVRK